MAEPAFPVRPDSAAPATAPATAPPSTERENELIPEDDRPVREMPDLLTLVAGLACLVASVLAVIGWVPRFTSFDPRWVLAGGAVVIGLLMLLAGVSPRRNRR